MNIKGLSSKYVVKRLGDSDIQDILHLCCANTIYYEYCPPMVTEESIKKDMIVLPPNTGIDDKFYIGFYSEGKLIAVMDLIAGYPEQNIAYIGFFMTDVTIQKRGIGSEIISEVCDHLRQQNFVSVRLAWVKGNLQAEHFWLKNGFAVLKETTSNVADSVILAERCLNQDIFVEPALLEGEELERNTFSRKGRNSEK
ncbi:MAG: GNAT family N-acetyltransferase [Lachnospiraceae bacterium]|nr:GNAT family N-acetyltransferase [Lachnospiraceae bacterium]